MNRWPTFAASARLPKLPRKPSNPLRSGDSPIWRRRTTSAWPPGRRSRWLSQDASARIWTSRSDCQDQARCIDPLVPLCPAFCSPGWTGPNREGGKPMSSSFGMGPTPSRRNFPGLLVGERIGNFLISDPTQPWQRATGGGRALFRKCSRSSPVGCLKSWEPGTRPNDESGQLALGEYTRAGSAASFLGHYGSDPEPELWPGFHHCNNDQEHDERGKDDRDETRHA
jgi:hypothetical protein